MKSKADLEREMRIKIHQEVKEKEQALIKKYALEHERFIYDREKTYRWVSEIVGDYLYHADEQLRDFYLVKTRPAVKKAETVEENMQQRRELISENKYLKYELGYIRRIFPDLDEILDYYDYEGEDLDGEADPVKKYLEHDEYSSLNEEQRNQLSLDRYLKRSKKNWEIGRDFERYTGYVFENEGFQVEYHGIKKKLEDLGRDLLASNAKSVYVIQCKYWSREKVIHEKHIAQLYGTTIKYGLEHKEDTREKLPLFITHTELSDEAREFANALGVILQENVDIAAYPIIKCNRENRNGLETKIYHLPMDQQYDRVIIDKSVGDFYASTVKEAIDKGFRRAYKWTKAD